MGPSNFAHKRDLIRAELLRARHAHRPAAEAYEAAVISAAESGFVHDQALAHERAYCFIKLPAIRRNRVPTRKPQSRITRNGRLGPRVPRFATRCFPPRPTTLHLQPSSTRPLCQL